MWSGSWDIPAGISLESYPDSRFPVGQRLEGVGKRQIAQGKTCVHVYSVRKTMYSLCVCVCVLLSQTDTERQGRRQGNTLRE